VRPRFTFPSDPRLLVAFFDRDGRTWIMVNGRERDVTGWEQVTITLAQRADGGVAAMVALDGAGGAEAWVVECVGEADAR
jgi:hypothetical protein